MRTALVISAVCVALCLGCTARKAPQVDADTDRDDTADERAAAAPAVVTDGELMIQRTSCYGTCPAYTAYIDGDGRVFYHGQSDVEHIGLRTGRVDSGEVATLLDLTERNGYWPAEHDYDSGVTDSPTTFTAVVHDGRRQWVRNYAASAPPAVAMTEAAIDVLLERTRWDAQPSPDRPIREGVCVHLGRGIAERCAAVLLLEGTGGDCAHWFMIWDGLGPGPALPARCDRALRSLERAASPPIVRHDPILWGPNCRRWNREGPGACRTALFDGDIGGGPCVQAMRLTDTQLRGVLGDGESEPSLAGTEYFCGRWVGG